MLGAAGVGLAAFVRVAWLPQLGAAVAVGALLALRARWSGDLRDRTPDARPLVADGRAEPRPSLPAGVVAMAGAVGAVIAGLAGLDMAVPFALSAALLAGSATTRALVRPADIARALPLAALAVVLAAAWLSGPLATDARLVPHPAAAFGGVWLGHAAIPVLVAYLVGTNVAAMATPHGSAATMLVRSGGARRGVHVPVSAHVATAWPYALAGSAVALALLGIVAR